LLHVPRSGNELKKGNDSSPQGDEAFAASALVVRRVSRQSRGSNQYALSSRLLPPLDLSLQLPIDRSPTVRNEAPPRGDSKRLTGRRRRGTHGAAAARSTDDAPPRAATSVVRLATARLVPLSATPVTSVTRHATTSRNSWPAAESGAPSSWSSLLCKAPASAPCAMRHVVFSRSVQRLHASSPSPEVIHFLLH
jgi:hypothetical protein